MKEELRNALINRTLDTARDVQDTVEAFMQHWKNKDWSAMLRYCQLTWLQDTPNADQYMKQFIAGRRIVEYHVGLPVRAMRTETQLLPPTFMNVPVKAIYKTHTKAQPVTKIINVLCICELGYQRDSLEGEWTVNPVSTLREDNPK